MFRTDAKLCKRVLIPRDTLGKFVALVGVVLSCSRKRSPQWNTMSPTSFAKICVQHVKAAFSGSVGWCWTVANKRPYTGCQKYTKSARRELQNSSTSRSAVNIPTVTPANQVQKNQMTLIQLCDPLNSTSLWPLVLLHDGRAVIPPCFPDRCPDRHCI